MLIFNIESKLRDDLEISQELIKHKDYRLEYFIEGHLEIYINNQMWFYDEYFNLIEFGVSLINWLKSVKESSINYSFNSIDHDETIFRFTLADIFSWNIYSPWEEFKVNEPIEHRILINEIQKFLTRLDKDLFKKYEFKLNDFNTNCR